MEKHIIEDKNLSLENLKIEELKLYNLGHEIIPLTNESDDSLKDLLHQYFHYGFISGEEASSRNQLYKGNFSSSGVFRIEDGRNPFAIKNFKPNAIYLKNKELYIESGAIENELLGQGYVSMQAKEVFLSSKKKSNLTQVMREKYYDECWFSDPITNLFAEGMLTDALAVVTPNNETIPLDNTCRIDMLYLKPKKACKDEILEQLSATLARIYQKNYVINEIETQRKLIISYTFTNSNSIPAEVDAEIIKFISRLNFLNISVGYNARKPSERTFVIFSSRDQLKPIRALNIPISIKNHP